jgi:hypothetical protein
MLEVGRPTARFGLTRSATMKRNAFSNSSNERLGAEFKVFQIKKLEIVNSLVSQLESSCQLAEPIDFAKEGFSLSNVHPR